jgi:hypothetical protein
MASGGSDNWLFKVIGGAFATIVAPLSVAILLKYLDRPEQPPSDAASQSSSVSSAGPLIRLFNGKDLTGFYTNLGPPKEGAKPLGKNKDTEKVFTVVDGELRISGKVYGALLTEKEYDNYHLTAEYKWGTKIWPPNEEKARRGGILLHCTGPDDAINDAYPRTLKCLLNQGAAGDFTLAKAPTGSKIKVSFSVETDIIDRKDGATVKKDYRYRPGAPLTPLTSGSVRRLDCEPVWQDSKDAKLTQKVENPVGQWNKIECICQGDKVTIRINDKTVNVASKMTPTKGKIGFQSLGAEIAMRNILLRPLPKK